MVVAGGASTHALIPLYAVGVFIDFTISQAGMVRHWIRTRRQGWRRRLTINAVGCVLTGIIAVVVTSVKFIDGAWLVLLLIPTLVGVMLFIRRQYDAQDDGARRPRRPRVRQAAPRAAGRDPGQRHQPRRSSRP